MKRNREALCWRWTDHRRQNDRACWRQSLVVHRMNLAQGHPVCDRSSADQRPLPRCTMSSLPEVLRSYMYRRPPVPAHLITATSHTAFSKFCELFLIWHCTREFPRITALAVNSLETFWGHSWLAGTTINSLDTQKPRKTVVCAGDTAD